MSKYKVGDKFIVEIEEIYNGDLVKHEDHLHLHRIKGFNSLVLDEYGLDKLEKVESSANIAVLQAQAYNQGLNDASEFVRKLYDMKCDELERIFGVTCGFYGVIGTFTIQEAMERMKAYEEAQIEVGDVVKSKKTDSFALLVLEIHDDTFTGFDGKETHRCMIIDNFRKTGKHIDISLILEQIGE